MGFQPTLIAFVVLVVVGAGGRMGAVIAVGFLIAVIETLAAGYISNTSRGIVVFAGLVVFLAVRPEGAVQQASSTKVRLCAPLPCSVRPRSPTPPPPAAAGPGCAPRRD